MQFINTKHFSLSVKGWVDTERQFNLDREAT